MHQGSKCSRQHPTEPPNLPRKLWELSSLQPMYLGCIRECAQAIMGRDRGLTDENRPGSCKGIGHLDSRHIGARRLEPAVPGALQGASLDISTCSTTPMIVSAIGLQLNCWLKDARKTKKKRNETISGDAKRQAETTESAVCSWTTDRAYRANEDGKEEITMAGRKRR